MVRWQALLARGRFATGVGDPGFRALKGARFVSRFKEDGPFEVQWYCGDE
jgi:hypothetical protein